MTRDVDSATLLSRRSRRNASKGAWLLVLVLVLAALAGGTGWFFGAGPGSLVPVPDVAGAATYADAATALTAESFVPSEQAAFDIDVPAGTVIGTDPPAGSRLEAGAAVAVLVSQGPAPRDIPALSGLSASDARQVLDDARLVVGEDGEVFSDAEPGSVVGALVTSRGDGSSIDCAGGCTVLEGDSASLDVSVGPVPDVAGLSITDATETLSGVGVSVSGEYAEDVSDTVEEGRVIGVQQAPTRPSDTVTLVVSQGPPLFAVPDVVGVSLAVARDTLAAAGFEIEYDDRWDGFPDAFTVVESQSPAAGTERPAGEVVSLRIRASL